jgi:hypothetical protein
LGRAGLPVVATTLIVLTVAYMITSDAMTDAALSWSSWARIALVFVLLFPVGLLLGVFLPTGMDAVVDITDAAPSIDRGRLVAWCWAVNGFFSVLGSSLTTIASMALGFDRALQIGLVLYVVAVAMMALGQVKRSVDEAAVAIREPAPV